jgi:hypothetical protein
LRARAVGNLLLDVRVGALALRREVAVGAPLAHEPRGGLAVLAGVTGLEDYLLVIVRDAEPREPFEDGAR